MATILKNKRWEIKSNDNMPNDVGFLLHKGHCVGGYDLDVSLMYVVTVYVPWNKETGSDVELIGKYETIAEAVAALWDNKEFAYIEEE